MEKTLLDLLELRNIAKAATQGPWESRINDLTDDVTVAHDQEYVLEVAWLGGKDQPQSVRDAEHIAAFDPPTVLALLDRAEAAEAKVAAGLELARNHAFEATVEYGDYGRREVEGVVVVDAGDLRTALDGSA